MRAYIRVCREREKERERGGKDWKKISGSIICVRFHASAGAAAARTTLTSSSAATGTVTDWRIFRITRAYFFLSFFYLIFFSLGILGGEKFDKCAKQSAGCANSGAASHCRLIFERLVYTRLVLKKFISRWYTHNRGEREGERRWAKGGRKGGRGGGREGGREFGDRVDKAIQMLSAKFKVPLLSPTNERVQLNIGLTKNTTTLVRHSRSCHSLSPRIIRYIKLYLAGYTRRRRRVSSIALRQFFPSSLSLFLSSASFGEKWIYLATHAGIIAGSIYAMRR